MSGLVGTYQIRETDYVDSNSVASWSNINTGVISYNAGLADTEANWERSFACYQIACAANGDGAQIVYANFKDTGANFAPGTAGQYPRRGLWIRCDDATAVLTIVDQSTVVTAVSTSMSVTTANKWQYVEIDISPLNTLTESYFQVTANKACNFWIARINWVNQTRTGSTANPQDERVFETNAYITYTRCNVVFLATTTVQGVVGQGCYWNGTSIESRINPTILDASLTPNLFTGSVNNWIVNNATFDIYATLLAGTHFNNVYVYGHTGAGTWFFTGYGGNECKTVLLTNIYSYGGTYGIVEGNGGGFSGDEPIMITGGKVVGGSYGLRACGGLIKLVDVIKSATNPPSLGDFSYVSAAGITPQYELYGDGQNNWSASSISPFPTGAAGLKFISIFTRLYLITNPATSGLYIIGYADPFYTNTMVPTPLAYGITDISGKVTITALYREASRTYNYGTSDANVTWSSVLHPWTFYVINTGTGQVLATYTADITNGIGTALSPVTINLTDSAPVVFSVSISPAVGATNKDALTLTAVINGTPAPDRVYAVLTDGTYYKVKVMALVSANTYQCVYPPSWAWVKTYTTAQLYVDATNSYGRGTGNLGASYTVAEGDGTNAADIMYDGQQVRKQVQSQIVTIQN